MQRMTTSIPVNISFLWMMRSLRQKFPTWFTHLQSSWRFAQSALPPTSVWVRKMPFTVWKMWPSSFPVCCRIPMPFYKAVSQEDSMVDDENSPIKKKEKRFPNLIYMFAFLYFAFSCGMEGFFQSQTFTFGICGPHKLNPKEVDRYWDAYLRYIVEYLRCNDIRNIYGITLGCFPDDGVLCLFPRWKVHYITRLSLHLHILEHDFMIKSRGLGDPCDFVDSLSLSLFWFCRLGIIDASLRHAPCVNVIMMMMNYSIFIFISPFLTLPWGNKCRLVNLGLYSSDLYSLSQILCLRNKNRGTKRNLKQTLIHKECFAPRFSGVLVSSLLRPQVMILVSLVSCVMAALLLSLTAATSLALLYTGVGVIGFFISLQFASGH